jgi:hypothetical protein
MPSFSKAASAPSSCAVLDRGLPGWLAQLDPVIAPAVRNAESVSATDYLARLARLRALARSVAPRLDAADVIASPTLCLTPPLMSDVADADSHLRVNRRIVRNTVAANYLGLCAITLPVGRDRAAGRLRAARLRHRHGGLGADTGVHRYGRPEGHARALAGRWRRAAVPDLRHAGPSGA